MYIHICDLLAVSFQGCCGGPSSTGSLFLFFYVYTGIHIYIYKLLLLETHTPSSLDHCFFFNLHIDLHSFIQYIDI